MAKFMQVRERVANETAADELRKAAREAKKALAESAKTDAAAAPETFDALVKAQEDKKYAKTVRSRAKAYMAEHLPDYAQLHLKATRVAAEKGDARPAEWALQSVKAGGEGAVVDPPAKQEAPQGVKILIGVNLGGLGEVGVVSASNEEKANEGLPAPGGRLPHPRVVEGTVVGGPGA